MPLSNKIVDTIAVAPQRDKESITPDSRLDSLGINSLNIRGRIPLSKVVDTIAAATQCNKESITPDSRLDGLGIDSLKAINIVYELEEEFGIEVPNEAIAEMVTVNDIYLAITNLLAEAES